MLNNRHSRLFIIVVVASRGGAEIQLIIYVILMDTLVELSLEYE